jgi:hypothetical protein
MSTDDDLDVRLQQAGLRWREKNTVAAAVDLAAATAVERDADAANGPEVGSTEVPLVLATPKTSRRRKGVWAAAVAGIAAAVVAAFVVVQVVHDGSQVQVAEGAGVKELTSTQWNLDYAEFGSDPKLTATENESLRFEGGMIVGFDGTNTYGGPVTISADHLSIGDLWSTLLGRLPGYVGDGIDPTKITSGNVQWVIQDDTLTVTKNGVGMLVYRAQTSTTDPKALIGVTWQLVSMSLGSGALAASSDSVIAGLVIDASGHYRSSYRCAATEGIATVRSGQMTITSSHPDLSYRCPTALSASEIENDANVDRILSGTVTWSITDGQLTITKAGVGSLVFQPKDIDPGFTGTSGAPSNLPSATSTK